MQAALCHAQVPTAWRPVRAKRARTQAEHRSSGRDNRGGVAQRTQLHQHAKEPQVGTDCFQVVLMDDQNTERTATRAWNLAREAGWAREADRAVAALYGRYGVRCSNFGRLRRAWCHGANYSVKRRTGHMISWWRFCCSSLVHTTRRRHESDCFPPSSCELHGECVDEQMTHDSKRE